jgi:uncharacterized protein
LPDKAKSNSFDIAMTSWKTYDGQPIDEPIEHAVEKVLQQFAAEKRPIRICVGSDSRVKGHYVNMATVIVFYVIGNGGFMYVCKQRLYQRMSMKQRMLTEVTASIETAWKIHNVLIDYNIPLEVHADINQDPRHKSCLALHDAKGYTKGMGFTFIAKPDAFASSICADRLCQ